MHESSSSAGEDGPRTAAQVDPVEIQAQLERILQSRGFKNSERLQRFLTFAVE
jgi:hypothetical protein